MISKLLIKNYALIDHLSLEFSKGYTAITGETGAGKSIILGAMGMALGKRADSSVLRNPEVKCVVEIQVDIQSFGLEAVFKELDLEYDDLTILRREIQPSGRSRAFINDSPVNLKDLQNIASNLIDIHSQQDTVLLNNQEYQLNVVDGLAKNEKVKKQYTSVFDTWVEANSVLKKLEQESSEEQDADYLSFLCEELDHASIKKEDEALEDDLKKLEHGEEIVSSLQNAFTLLDADHGGVLEQLQSAEQSIQSVVAYNGDLSLLAERVSSARIELQDVSYELQQLSQELSLDSKAVAEVRERFDFIQHLLQKHRALNIEELQVKHQKIQDALFTLENRDRLIKEQQQKIEGLEKELRIQAKKLSSTRKKVIPALEKNIIDILASLNFKDARFEIAQKEEGYTKSGFDRLELLFSANPGMPMKTIAKAASGGELSRLMLALKSVIANSEGLPTIIFDEIDTGVSGDTAKKMAEIIKGMGANMQVWAITHLPQIAAAGEQHLWVEKWTEGKVTHSKLRPLEREERILKIAQMLSHSEPTKAAIENAKELISVS